MSSGLIDIMKRSALEAVEAGKPCDLRYGTVISVEPLKVRVTNQFIIPKSMLIVPEYLTDYEIEVTVTPDYGWNTQDRSGGGGEAAFASHNHDIYFEHKKIKIHGALKVDDKVVLLRQAGGQQFLVLDRLPKEQVIA